jgi:hypothetical protein
MSPSHPTRGRWALSLVAALGMLAASDVASAAPSTRAFLRLDLPKHTAYVGESIPVTVRAYYRDDTNVTITGAPTLTDADFTLRAKDPAQGHEVIDGVSYLVVTWKDRLSPVKAGHYALGADVPSTLDWRSAVSMRVMPTNLDPFGGDPFGDPSSGSAGGGDPFAQMQQQMQQMMNHAFAESNVGPAQHKDLVLHAPRMTLDVRALPAAGRPADFTGAVGHFMMTATADPTRTRAGEPVTLALHVKGDGSFDRINVAGLADSSDWKTYSPSATDGDGEKVFKQPIVPLRAGVDAIPPASFSFFDPDTSRYVSVATAPIPIEVAPGAATASGSNGHIPAATTGPTLAPNADTIGRPVAGLAPVFTRRWFWAAQGIPFAALASALFVTLRRRRLAADPDRPRRREAKRALRAQRFAMDRAIAAGDGTAFFAAARGALQQSLGARWRLEPSAISLSEIDARLGAEEVQKLRPVFDADAARFSGEASSETDLAGWKAAVERELEHFEHMEAS